jgi:hypothetical protein
MVLASFVRLGTMLARSQSLNCIDVFVMSLHGIKSIVITCDVSNLVLSALRMMPKDGPRIGSSAGAPSSPTLC